MRKDYQRGFGADMGYLFHRDGLVHAKDLDWTKVVLTLWTKRTKEVHSLSLALTLLLYLSPGASIPPETMMHFPPCFRFLPYFRNIFRLWEFFFTILPFPETFLDFHPPKYFWWPVLVIDHKFTISPYFPCFSTFPPCFAKIIISPLLSQISLLF